MNIFASTVIPYYKFILGNPLLIEMKKHFFVIEE